MIVHVCFKGGGGGTFFPSTVLWGRPSLLLQTRPPRTLACHHSIPCLPGSFFRTWPKNDHDLAIALSVQLLFNIVRSLAPAPKGKCSSGGMAKTAENQCHQSMFQIVNTLAPGEVEDLKPQQTAKVLSFS